MQLLEDLRGTAMMQQLRHKVGRGPKGLKKRPKVNCKRQENGEDHFEDNLFFCWFSPFFPSFSRFFFW